MTAVATGLALGVAYGLVGVAVAAVAQAARTLHLAVGSVLVAGVTTRLLLGGLGVPDAPAVVAALAVGAATSAALEPAVLRPFDGVVARLVALAAAGAVLDGVIAVTVGTRQFRPTPLLPGGPLAVAVAIGAPAALLLAAAVRWTVWGRRLRLVGGSPDAAALAGISPGRTRAGALAVSGVAAVVAGLLVAPLTSVGAGQGPAFTVRAVAAGVLLGVGGPVRALVAGLLLGLVEAGGRSVWPRAGATVAVASAAIAVLAARGGELARGWSRPW